MAIDFPSVGLVVGQLFTAPTNGVTYRWDGTLWLTQAGPGGGTGDFFASGSPSGSFSSTIVVINPSTVRSGNSGGWYNSTTGAYTPPAGRFTLFAYATMVATSANGQAALYLYKNGIQIPNVVLSINAPVGGAVSPSLQTIVDANGTDVFTMRINCSVASTLYDSGFGAFPLTGMQGPVGAPATGYLLSNTTATITTGYTYTPFNIGTVSSGTTTLAGANGNYQYMTNNGASTIAAPAADTAISLLITNGASAGAITFSGFTVGASTGDALTTTNTSKFLINVVRINATSTYLIKALQ